MLSGLAVSALFARRSKFLSFAGAATALASAAFFRDPDVRIEAETNEVVSAADGFVLGIDRVVEPWWIQGEADRIAVFLSLFDVHVNRWPVSGRFVAVRKVPGRFAPAFLRSENNCKDLLALETPRGPVAMAQISGVLARRSVQWCKTGDTVEAGDRLGMIRFGSRTDVYLPAGQANILVKEGQRVRAGQTLIARYRI